MLQCSSMIFKSLVSTKTHTIFQPSLKLNHSKSPSWGPLLMRTRLQELLFSSHLDVQAFREAETIKFMMCLVLIEWKKQIKNGTHLEYYLQKKQVPAGLFNPFQQKKKTSPPAHPREECSLRCSAHWSADQRQSTWNHHHKPFKSEVIYSVGWRFTLLDWKNMWRE